jgi:hypothetical protein
VKAKRENSVQRKLEGCFKMRFMITAINTFAFPKMNVDSLEN